MSERGMKWNEMTWHDMNDWNGWRNRLINQRMEKVKHGRMTERMKWNKSMKEMRWEMSEWVTELMRRTNKSKSIGLWMTWHMRQWPNEITE